jgi:hypothetical protein
MLSPPQLSMSIQVSFPVLLLLTCLLLLLPAAVLPAGAGRAGVPAIGGTPQPSTRHTAGAQPTQGAGAKQQGQHNSRCSSGAGRGVLMLWQKACVWASLDAQAALHPPAFPFLMGVCLMLMLQPGRS